VQYLMDRYFLSLEEIPYMIPSLAAFIFPSEPTRDCYVLKRRANIWNS
jgi:hypothetical protein